MLDTGIIDLACPLDTEHPLAQGLVACWMVLPGWDGGRFWYDLAGNNVGTLTNMTTSASGWRGTTRPGGFGHVAFDGTDDYVSIAAAPAIQPVTAITLCQWIKTSGTGSVSLEKSNNPGSDDSYQFYVPSTVRLTVAGASVSSATAVTDNRWHHLCGTYNGSTMAIYIDGNQEASASLTGNITYSSQPLWIGQNNPASRQVNGSIDDTRIYSRALSAAEVWALYRTPVLGYPELRHAHAPLAGASSAVTFRRTLHELGTRSGSRQLQRAG